MERSLLLQVWVLARLAGTVIDDAVEPSGLVAREFVLYSLLVELGETTPTDLARLSGVPATTISKMLRRMVQRGHFEEMDNPEDARSRIIRLTGAGQAAQQDAATGFADATATLAADLDAEGDQIAWSLERLQGALRRLTGLEAGELAPRPTGATAPAVRYVGRELDAAQSAEVAQFIDFVRRNG